MISKVLVFPYHTCKPVGHSQIVRPLVHCVKSDMRQLLQFTSSKSFVRIFIIFNAYCTSDFIIFIGLTRPLQVPYCSIFNYNIILLQLPMSNIKPDSTFTTTYVPPFTKLYLTRFLQLPIFIPGLNTGNIDVFTICWGTTCTTSLK